MHLKRLELHGYKSFANRTEFLFSDGVTAVVGPNGSGKSNIADAIQWALGEVNADVPPNLKEVAPGAFTNPPYPEPKPATTSQKAIQPRKQETR